MLHCNSIWAELSPCWSSRPEPMGFVHVNLEQSAKTSARSKQGRASCAQVHGVGLGSEATATSWGILDCCHPSCTNQKPEDCSTLHKRGLCLLPCWIPPLKRGLIMQGIPLDMWEKDLGKNTMYLPVSEPRKLQQRQPKLHVPVSLTQGMVCNSDNNDHIFWSKTPVTCNFLVPTAPTSPDPVY